MITVRSARQDEADLLAEIGLRAWEKAMIPVGETRAMVDNARRAFQNFTHSSWITISVVETAGIAAGWAAREELDDNITDFWIDPDYQGRGLGSILLAEIESEIARQGFDQARLETHARNEEAVNFFQKHGYSVHWLTISYNPKLDRDVQTVGLSKPLTGEEAETYGPGGEAAD